MPRFKPVDYHQVQWIGAVFEGQILPGTFEYTLNYLVDHTDNLKVFEDRQRNEDGGSAQDTCDAPLQSNDNAGIVVNSGRN